MLYEVITQDYAQALKAASSIEDTATLKKSEQELNNNIILRSAIISRNKEATDTSLKKILHPRITSYNVCYTKLLRFQSPSRSAMRSPCLQNKV